MTTLTVSLLEGGGAAVLDLVPWGQVTGITRTDANGSTPLRVPAGTFPRSTPLQLVDWEAALGSPVRYTADGVSATVTLPAGNPWFVAPLRPAMSLQVEAVTSYSAARAALGTIHQVVDRPDPLVALGRLGTRAGNLTAWVPDHAAGDALADLIDRAGVVFYRQSENPGMDMYFVSTGMQLTPADPDGWQLSVSYQEISRPVSPVDTARWTFGDVSHSFASFRNVSTNYADFESLSFNDQTGVI